MKKNTSSYKECCNNCWYCWSNEFDNEYVCHKKGTNKDDFELIHWCEYWKPKIGLDDDYYGISSNNDTYMEEWN